MQSLNHLVAAGKVIYLGISDTPAWLVTKCNEYARSHGLRPFSVYQGRWSAEHRDFERDIIPMATHEGMGLCPWGALGGGNFKTDEARQKKDGRNMGQASEAAIKVSKVLEKIANKKSTQITSVALAYVMKKTPYVFPIVGGRTKEHLKSNIEALALELSQEDVDEIEGAVPFDIGFPQNFLAHGKGVTNPGDIWLMNLAGHQDHPESIKVCIRISMGVCLWNTTDLDFLGHSTTQEVRLRFSVGGSINDRCIDVQKEENHNSAILLQYIDSVELFSDDTDLLSLCSLLSE